MLERSPSTSHRVIEPVSAGAERVTVGVPLLSRGFVALIAVNVVFSCGFAAFFLLPKFMVQELAAGPTEIGVVSAAFGISMIASIPLVGWLLDGSRTREVLVAGCVLMAVASLGFVRVREVGPAIVVLRGLQGVAMSLFHNAAAVLVAKLSPPTRLAQALGIFAGSGMIMTAIAPALSEWCAAEHGYGSVFALAALSSSLAAPLALRVEKVRAHSTRKSSLRGLLRRKRSLRMIAVLSNAGLGFGVMFAFSTPFALELGVENVRGFFFAFAGGAAFVRFGLGGLIDRVGHLAVATVALLSYGLVVMAMYLLVPEGLPVIGALFGVSHGLFLPAFTAFMVGKTREHERGKLLTLFNGAFNVGNCVVLLLGGVAEAVGYRALFAGTGALVAATPLLMWRWPHEEDASPSI